MNGFAQQAYSMDNSTKMSEEVMNGVLQSHLLYFKLREVLEVLPGLEVLSGLAIQPNILHPHLLTKVKSQLISNVCTDALSAEKASHVALECTLQSHPNMMHVHGKQVRVVTNTTIAPLYLNKTIWALTDRNLNVKVESDGHDAENSKQSTSDMTAFIRSKPAPANGFRQCLTPSLMGNRIDELEQTINDLRSEMGQEGYITPPAQLKSKEEPR
ncbi:hypothetical protein OROGR_017080 [Orobanche gracilis]